MKHLSLILFTLAVIGLCGSAMAADDGRVDTYGDGNGIRIGSDGTKINLLAAGQVDIANGTTSTALTVPSAFIGDVAVVTPNESLGSAAKFSAACTTNTVTVILDADPQTTVTFNYIIIGK